MNYWMNSEWIVPGEAPKTGHLILVIGQVMSTIFFGNDKFCYVLSNRMI